MELKHAILATEGANDQAAISKVLRTFGLESFKGSKKNLDTFWLDIIPRRKDTDNLYDHEHMHMPRFFTSRTHSVAVYQGHGSELPQNLSDLMTLYPSYTYDIHALGIIVDADNYQPGVVVKKYVDKLQPFFPAISSTPGTIAINHTSSEGIPRIGVYVLPDNEKTGTLDSILVECADCVYPEHKVGAEVFLDSVNSTHKGHWKPFDREKAVIATIVSVIHPGIANTLSIARDNWICDQTVSTIVSVAAMYKFIGDLLDLPIR